LEAVLFAVVGVVEKALENAQLMAYLAFSAVVFLILRHEVGEMRRACQEARGQKFGTGNLRQETKRFLNEQIALYVIGAIASVSYDVIPNLLISFHLVHSASGNHPYHFGAFQWAGALFASCQVYRYLKFKRDYY
jgi:hypothetical protein